ncbi:MAG TPA: VOC family protein [Candidatus Binatia bacterium]|jgi:catechol 2,3-dioxygenase-like lactoylglutathione lyase family enzyme|nr:VOC family protein [Candidatus Binatia bacterium]
MDPRAPATRPLRVAELDHVVVRCADQVRTLDFYTRVLGLVEERRLDAIGLVQLRAGRSLLDLVPADAPPAFEARNVDHFCLGIEVDDLDALVRYLAAAGVPILGEPTERYGAHGSGPSLYVTDPEGNVVELKQMPRRRPPG